MSNKAVVPVVSNIFMADPVQNQHTFDFSTCSSVVRFVPDQDIQAECFILGCSFCSRQILLALRASKSTYIFFFDP